MAASERPAAPPNSTRAAAASERCARAAALGLLLAALVPASAGAQGIWRLEQPAPPQGAPFKVPLGTPGDLRFWAPNRGLLAVEGNSTIPRGLFYYNGQEWRQLSTVCGGPGDSTRIAWAGPREFWTITEPSRPRIGSGTSLCRFKDGQVVASYSTADQSPDPYRPMRGASCAGENDCWFAGVGAQDPTGERAGAFHLRWDGTNLTTVYAPQGRGVTDVEPFAGRYWESLLIGRAPENTTDEIEPRETGSDKPRLLGTIANGVFDKDPFTFADRTGVPPDGTELLTLDSDGQQLWAGGGGAASGEPGSAAAKDVDRFVERPPAALRSTGAGWQELPLSPLQFAQTERIADIAAVPGTASAWAAVQPYADRRSLNAKAKVALLAPDGTSTVTRLPTSGAGRGSAARIEFTGPNEGWLVTYAGWLFHYTDGTPLPRDEDPAFGSLITFRPNEAAEQFIPDAPPQDDSLLFAPPPVEVEQQSQAAQAPAKRLPALLRDIKVGVRNKRTLVVSFRLRRTATISLIAIRKKKVVARTTKRKYRPGKVTLSLKLDPKRWPTRLKFSVREKGQVDSGGGSDVGGGDTQTTGGDTTTTTGGAGGDNVTTRGRIPRK